MLAHVDDHHLPVRLAAQELLALQMEKFAFDQSLLQAGDDAPALCLSLMAKLAPMSVKLRNSR